MPFQIITGCSVMNMNIENISNALVLLYLRVICVYKRYDYHLEFQYFIYLPENSILQAEVGCDITVSVQMNPDYLVDELQNTTTLFVEGEIGNLTFTCTQRTLNMVNSSGTILFVYSIP